jgi:hypothetical protein
MAIVGGFDLHRTQITFDCLDTETGEVSTGQIRPATRDALRRWLDERLAGRADVAIALEGCTGWRFAVEELERAGGGGPPRRARRHRHPPRPQEAGQDRPRRRAAAAGAAASGSAARVVDPARACPGGAHAGADVHRAHGRAAGLAAAHPRPALPPGRAARRRPADLDRPGRAGRHRARGDRRPDPAHHPPPGPAAGDRRSRACCRGPSPHTMGSARSPRSSCGPSWATPDASAAPTRPSASPGST